MTVVPEQQYRYINPSYLFEMSEGDVDFMCVIATTFLQEAPHELAQLVEEARQRNVQKVSEIRHKLKTTLAIIGVSDILDDISILQAEQITEIHIEKIISSVNKINERFHKCCDELTIFMAEISKRK